MAGAGSIILNIPGRAGPYRVRPQKSVFALPQTPAGQGLRGASDVMTLLTQAKGLADMVAPFITTQQPAAQQFDESRQAAQEAIADVQGMRAAQDEQRASQAFQSGANDLAAARQAMEQARQAHGVEGIGMMSARMDTPPGRSPEQAYLAAVDMVNQAQTPEELQFAQQHLAAAQQGIQPQMAAGPAQPLRPMFKPGTGDLSGMRAEGIKTPTPITGQGAPMPEDRGPQQPTVEQALAPEPEVGAELRGTGFHPEDEVLRFGSLAEAQAAMMAASANNDVAAYNRAVQALEFSPLSDVRPQSMADVITGDHFRRAKMGLMQAIKPPTAPTALDRARLADIQSRIEDRAFKQVMAIQGDDRAQTDMLRKQALARMEIAYKRAKLPGIHWDNIKKGVEARVWGKQLASQRAKNYGQAFAARQSGRLRKQVGDLRDVTPGLLEGQEIAKTIQAQQERQDISETRKDIRQKKSLKAREEAAAAGKTRAVTRGVSQANLQQIKRDIGRALREQRAADSKLDSLRKTKDSVRDLAAQARYEKEVRDAQSKSDGAAAWLKSLRKQEADAISGLAGVAPAPKPESVDLSEFEIPE